MVLLVKVMTRFGLKQRPWRWLLTCRLLRLGENGALKAREDLIAYAKSENIPITVSAAKPYSMDRNLLHISYEGGLLEDPMNEPDESMYILTKSIADTPNEEHKLEIQFENGNAVAVDNKKMTPAQIIQHLNKVGGEHGVGRIDIVENRLVGIKSRGCYETPGGTILHLAHRDLESITIERELQHKKDEISLDYARMVYNGLWFHPKRLALQHFIDYTQRTVNGTVKVSLFKGNVRIIGRSSPNSLYRSQLASFEGNEDYNQADAAGFIKLFWFNGKGKLQKLYFTRLRWKIGRAFLRIPIGFQSNTQECGTTK